MSIGATPGPAPRELLAYAFPPGVSFEGRLSTAMQRIESGGALRVLDALFVGREPDSGEIAAVSLQGQSSAGMITALVGFRLDDRAREQHTRDALAGPAGDAVRALAERLEPGWAIAAVLVEHLWAQVLEDAVARIGGRALADERLDAAAAEEAWSKLPERLDLSAGGTA